MIELIGWIGSLAFAICGVPQAVECYKTRNADGLTWSFLFLWFIGELGTIIYVIPRGDIPLLFNYTCNFMCLLVILYYKFIGTFYED